MSSTTAITIRDLHKAFASREVLAQLNLELSAGDFISVVGPSGCGKSTLLRLIAGLDKPTSGQIILNPDLTQKAGFVFQEANLLPWRTCLENVLLPFEVNPLIKDTPKTQARKRALEALEKVRLDRAANLFPHELSGGMKMRVALARALVTEANLLLLDEPFASLDEVTRAELQKELRVLCSQQNLTVLFVTHSLSEAVFLSDRVIMLKSLDFSSGESSLVEDKKISFSLDRDDSLRTTEPFNKLVRELSEGLRA